MALHGGRHPRRRDSRVHASSVRGACGNRRPLPRRRATRNPASIPRRALAEREADQLRRVDRRRAPTSGEADATGASRGVSASACFRQRLRARQPAGARTHCPALRVNSVDPAYTATAFQPPQRTADRRGGH
ncbi:MAG: hypothetical protein AVDCRST_MAG53-1069 [uncultured Solirubrobacteraceae bacterium]|uniref:Uncharacterized protein n=1 Tax=uncultured Solirubrobacteraceae bacterium TaxID=1162706 RepID=A0A6J4SAQ3_9ACTN|nr:MAG: hypothetical protein AVDCRST_MAG53-1069 [uncultured Solirubrobacteraceae bacterium]